MQTTNWRGFTLFPMYDFTNWDVWKKNPPLLKMGGRQVWAVPGGMMIVK
jgi:hypothetical protein